MKFALAIALMLFSQPLLVSQAQAQNRTFNEAATMRDNAQSMWNLTKLVYDDAYISYQQIIYDPKGCAYRAGYLHYACDTWATPPDQETKEYLVDLMLELGNNVGGSYQTWVSNPYSGGANDWYNWETWDLVYCQAMITEQSNILGYQPNQTQINTAYNRCSLAYERMMYTLSDRFLAGIGYAGEWMEVVETARDWLANTYGVTGLTAGSW